MNIWKDLLRPKVDFLDLYNIGLVSTFSVVDLLSILGVGIWIWLGRHLWLLWRNVCKISIVISQSHKNVFFVEIQNSP